MLDNLIGSLVEGKASMGLDTDGAVRRDEFDTAREPIELSPDRRGELESFVQSRIPDRHQFMDAKGRRCVVYFDERGRAADSPLSEISGGELVRMAKGFGWNGEIMDVTAKKDGDPGYGVPREEAKLEPGMGVVKSIPIINARPREDDLSEELKDALTKVRERFGESVFGLERAWLAGLSKVTLRDLVDVGHLRVVEGDQFRLATVSESGGWGRLGDELSEEVSFKIGNDGTVTATTKRGYGMKFRMSKEKPFVLQVPTSDGRFKTAAYFDDRQSALKAIDKIMAVYQDAIDQRIKAGKTGTDVIPRSDLDRVLARAVKSAVKVTESAGWDAQEEVGR